MENVVATLFVVAIGLYLLAQAVAIWRCRRRYLYERVIGVFVIGALVALWDGDANDTVLVSTIILIGTLSAEYWRFRARIRGDPTQRPRRRDLLSLAQRCGQRLCPCPERLWTTERRAQALRLLFH